MTFMAENIAPEFGNYQHLFAISPEKAKSFSDEELLREYDWAVKCYELSIGYKGETLYRTNLDVLKAEAEKRGREAIKQSEQPRRGFEDRSPE